MWVFLSVLLVCGTVLTAMRMSFRHDEKIQLDYNQARVNLAQMELVKTSSMRGLNTGDFD